MSDYNDDNNLYRNPDGNEEPSQEQGGAYQNSNGSYQNQGGAYQSPNGSYQEQGGAYQDPNSWQYPPQQDPYGNGYNQTGYNGYNGYNQGPNQNPYYTVPGQGQGQPPKKETNPMAVTSMVLGIFSIISCCASPLAVLLGIGGIVLAILSKKGKPMSGFTIAGVVLSAVGLVISLAFFAYYLFVLSMMKDPRYASFFNEILEQYEMLP